MSEKSKDAKLSRRNFLSSAGGFAAGALATGIGLNVLSSGADSVEAGNSDAPEWPFGYEKKLDPKKGLHAGYDGYKTGLG